LRASDSGDASIEIFPASSGGPTITLDNLSDNGLIILGDTLGNQSIILNAFDGSVTAKELRVSGSKQFVIEHPLDPNKEIHYVSLEGPEAAVFARGTARLINGEANIKLPDHFSLVANDQGLTVHLTPLSAASEGLAVVSKSTAAIGVRELRNGTGTYEFDYIVHAVRKGYEDFQVVRDKVEDPALKALAERERRTLKNATTNNKSNAGARETAGAAASESLNQPVDAPRSRK